MATIEHSLLMTRRLRRAGDVVHLAVDLPGGNAVHELTDLARSPADRRPAILVGGPPAEHRRLPDGGVLVGEGLFWALLDPLGNEALPQFVADDPAAVEAGLRAAAERFRRCTIRWHGLPADLRQRCARDVETLAPEVSALLKAFAAAAAPGEAATPAVSAETRPGPPVEAEDLFAWFTAADGLGAVVGDEFVPRPEQAEMGREVARGLEEGRALLVEAGTGVGKTLAYLVPLLALARERGVRSVVSTYTRALQAQIMDVDLPRLAPLLGEVRFQRLMGRRNYLCLRQRQAFLTRGVVDAADAVRLAAYRLWLHQTEDGMRDEVARNPVLAPVLGELFDAPDVCLPGHCYEGDRCFVQRARRRARQADILLVNHSLLLQDRRAGGTLLGEFDQLVVDEAHRLPAATLDAYGVACGPWLRREMENLLGHWTGDRGPERLALAGERLAQHGPEGERAASSAADVGRAVVRVFAAFERWWAALGAVVDEQWPAAGRDTQRRRIRDRDAFLGPARTETATLLAELAAAEGAQADLARRVSMLEELTPALEDDLAQIAQAGQMLRQTQADVVQLTGREDEHWVHWLEPARRGGLARLGATMLEAGEKLREIWHESGLAPVMTSATLSVGEDFTHMLGELGLTRRRPPARTWTCPSPFDYHRQMLLLTPQRFPDPSAGTFAAAVGEAMAALATRNPRKMMGLFTSYRAITEAAEALQAACPDRTVLQQTPRSATGALLAEFRARPGAILLGTATFWEGVDFPGDDLEILVVAKLPFLVPSDPWVEARCDRLSAVGENPFTSFMVRDAVLRLRQGVGRLIRRRSDRGVVLLLDNRLHTKNYGTTFLGALPAVPAAYGDLSDLLSRVDEFFAP